MPVSLFPPQVPESSEPLLKLAFSSDYLLLLLPVFTLILLFAIFLYSLKTKLIISLAVLPPLYSEGLDLDSPKNFNVGKP